MPMILQIMEGLKICGLLSTVQKYPKVWKSVFVTECMPVVTPTTLLDELEAVYSESQLIRQKEGDVFYQFCAVINSLEMKELKALLQWATGVSSIPPLGLPRKIKVTFLGGCNTGCRCRPTASTCDLRITFALHLDTFEEMKEILVSALKDSDGFHLL